MDFLWALIALALGFLLYPAWQLVRSVGRGSPRIFAPPPVSPAAKGGKIHAFSGGQIRNLEWVSMGQFTNLLAESNDLVVIDLRPESQHLRLRLPAAQVLTISPDELPEVLEWLPRNRSAAFCGASGTALSVIRASSRMRGSAPLYVLKDGSAWAEVA